jgi:AhpD family alkylhydroperoxidase
VRIRASQLNGCAYCIDVHTKDSRAVGETEQRIYAWNTIGVSTRTWEPGSYVP